MVPPQRRPAHQNTHANLIIPKRPAAKASSSGASPTRAAAPATVMAVWVPVSISSSTGWEPMSQGRNGHMTNE